MVTVVVPYRNDPSLQRTVDNLKELKVKYIVVNDCGSDRVGDIRNIKRRGVGGAIDIGVREVKTKYMCILASDTIFTKGHPEDMIRGETTISCATNIGTARRMGANLLLKLTIDDLPEASKPKHTLNYRNILEAKWRVKSEKKIPCVLGACYVMNTEWYRHLKGFLGHRMWGTLEPYISLKSWLAGGDCQITDVESNHIFGGNKNKTPQKYVLHNKLFVARTVLPEMADDLDDYLGNNNALRLARDLIDAKMDFVEQTRDYYQSIFTRTPEDVFKEFETL